MGLGKMNRFVLQITNTDMITSGAAEQDAAKCNHIIAPCKCMIENVYFAADVVETGNTLLLYLNEGPGTIVGGAGTYTQLASGSLAAGTDKHVAGTLVAAQEGAIYEKGTEFFLSENGTNTKDAEGVVCQVCFREMEP
jgi:hypothetical protein